MNKFSLQEIVKITGADPNTNDEIIFRGVTTDSREISPGVLFVALKGETFDGENFAGEAVEKGAAGVLVSKNFSSKIPGAILKVDDTLEAYQKIGGYWRDRFDIPVVAVTGSSGKTTTKDLTAAVLSSLGNIQKTSANFNNEIGVPLTLLGINDEHKAAVVEIGMRGLGQIASLAKFVKPTIAVITNVNETHIEILGSMENIAKAKGELAEAIKPGGTVILNADNPYTKMIKRVVAPGVKVLTFALDNPADLKAENISVLRSSTDFDLIYRGEKYHFDLPIIGRHNVLNSLAAMAAGIALGLHFEEVRHGFSTLVTTKMRFEIIRRDSLTIINDAYNASPASMRASLKTVSEIYEGRKFAVLGDMLELGDIAEKSHREIGKEVFENDFDVLVTYGELGKFIAAGAKDAGMEKVYTTENHEETAKKILSLIKDGDTILFKASHGMHLEKVIELI